jgi:methoxymalonate biosynthesis acyl carrier protein
MQKPKEKIRTYLKQFYDGNDITDNQDIFLLGFVDSLFAFKLVSFLEKEFHISISNKDLDFPNFMSINAIYEFVKFKEKVGEG